MRKRTVGMVCVLAVTACADWPPAVSTTRDIEALPRDERAVRGIGVTDEEVSLLAARLTQLDYVFLNSRSRITDKSISALAGLKYLRKMVIEDGSAITDDGLAQLRAYPCLRELILKNGRLLSRRGLNRLAELKSLQLLYIARWPQVTEEDLDRLRRSLPGCKIRDITKDE